MIVEDADVQTRINSGRYVIGLIDWILLQFNIRITSYHAIAVGIAFAIYAVTMTVLYLYIVSFVGKKQSNAFDLGVLLAVDFVFLNVLFSEKLIFVECCMEFALAYFLATIASILLVDRRKYIQSILCLMIAVCTYQNAAIFAMILMAFLIMFKNQCILNKKAFGQECIAITVGMICLLSNYLSIQILERMGYVDDYNKKINFLENWDDKFRKLLLIFYRLYRDVEGIFPPVFLPLIFMIICWGCILYQGYCKKIWNSILYIFLVWIGSHLLLLVFPVLMEYIYYTPRLSFVFFLIQGFLAITAMILSQNEKERNLIKRAVFGFVLANLLYCQFINCDHILSNTLDSIYVRMIENKIQKYEKQKGIEVNKIAVTFDTYAPAYYPEVSTYAYQINERSIGIVNRSVFQYYTGRDFISEEMNDEIYKKYFADKEWEFFDIDEQVIIEGDTLYWCIF